MFKHVGAQLDAFECRENSRRAYDVKEMKESFTVSTMETKVKAAKSSILCKQVKSLWYPSFEVDTNNTTRKLESEQIEDMKLKQALNNFKYVFRL